MRTIKEELSTTRWWMLPVLLVICFPCMVISHFVQNEWFCTFWGWHRAPGTQGNDGCSNTGTCPVCGKSVLQDSQGNWF